MRRDIGLFVVIIVAGLLLVLFSKRLELLGRGGELPKEVIDARWSPPAREYPEEELEFAEEEALQIVSGGKPFAITESKYKIPEKPSRKARAEKGYYTKGEGIKIAGAGKMEERITPLDLARKVSETAEAAKSTTSSAIIEEIKKKKKELVEALEPSPPPSPPPPLVEICGDGIDNDGDGLIDEGCPPPPVEICGDGIDNDGDGLIDEGCPPSHNVIFAKVGESVWEGNVKPEFMKAVIVETIKSTGNPFPSSQDVINWVKNNQDRAGQLLNNISQPYMR